MPGDDGGVPSRVRSSWQAAVSHWPTGAKLFASLSLALLPLALIAMLATWETTRTLAEDNRARLRIAAAESGHVLALDLVGDMSALQRAAAALDRDPADAPTCARAAGVFAQEIPQGARFAIRDAHGQVLCGERFPELSRLRRPTGPDGFAAVLLPDQGLVLGTASGRGHATGAALFPQSFLARASRPGGTGPRFNSTLIQRDIASPIILADQALMARSDTVRVPLGIDDLQYEMQVHSAPITWAVMVALSLPLLMWAAAAAIGWFVVDALLIRPLRRLRASVSAYHPGDVIDPGDTRAVPAQEIRDLGDTFRAISRTVALHEAGLAEGLFRQTKLTREVHHRVKNNLQVISSLINIHSRGSVGDGAAQAYATIQRRVDALAVVHRNHFAEAEVNRGLSLRSMLGELASNIRATAPDDAAQLGITLDIDPFLVNQDVGVAVAFLVTEMVELAMTVEPAPQLRISVKPADDPSRAVLRVSARALRDDDALKTAVAQRYGRVLEGLARQLRSKLHHDPLTGAYEIAIAVVGRD